MVSPLITINLSKVVPKGGINEPLVDFDSPFRNGFNSRSLLTRQPFFILMNVVTPPSGRGLVFFATQTRACLLSDHNIFTPRGEGEQRRVLMPLGLFLLFPVLFYFSRCWFRLIIIATSPGVLVI